MPCRRPDSSRNRFKVLRASKIEYNRTTLPRKQLCRLKLRTRRRQLRFGVSTALSLETRAKARQSQPARTPHIDTSRHESTKLPERQDSAVLIERIPQRRRQNTHSLDECHRSVREAHHKPTRDAQPPANRSKENGREPNAKRDNLEAPLSTDSAAAPQSKPHD